MEIPDLTLLIRRSQAGDRAAGARLFDLAYPFLKRIAARLLRGDTLQRELAPQDLIHDTWLTRISSRNAARSAEINDLCHYLASMTTAVKSQLIDHARRRKSLKRTSPETAGPLPWNPSGAGREESLALERELERSSTLTTTVSGCTRLFRGRVMAAGEAEAALLESNSPGNSQPETHRDDDTGGLRSPGSFSASRLSDR